MGLSVEEVISEIKDRWMEIDGVNGVMPGEDCILVHVKMKTPEIQKIIPSEFKGFPVKFIEGGEIEIQEISPE